jgi:sterol 3beta-glucosyltransferase
VLNAISRHVVPPPADWPPTATRTGYWFLPARSGEVSGELAACLAAGDPPVFVGVGSMAGPDPAATTAAVLSAGAQVGVRAVLATGWGGLTPAHLPDGVLGIDQVPHHLLPPHVRRRRAPRRRHHHRCRRGSRQTADHLPVRRRPAVLGRPHARPRRRTTPIHQRTLTADQLAAAVTRATIDPAMRRPAHGLGTAIPGTRHRHGGDSTSDLTARSPRRPGR